MKVFITGATSKIGKGVLDLLLKESDFEVLALSRKGQKNLDKITWIKADIQDLDTFQDPIITSIDLCLHFAAVTHSKDLTLYSEKNFKGTQSLARFLKKYGCQRIIYLSSQTASEDGGAYGKSKWDAENFLIQERFEELKIIRPSEVIGVHSNEGLEKFESMAHKKHFFPVLIDWALILYKPLSTDLLTKLILDKVFERGSACELFFVEGKVINTFQLAFFWMKKYKALPLPVFIPLLNLIHKLFLILKFPLFPPDQIQRLRGTRYLVPKGVTLIKHIELSAPSYG